MDKGVPGLHDLRIEDLRHSLEARLDPRMAAIERSLIELRQDWRRLDGRLWALLLLAVGGILTPIALRAV